MIIMAGSREDFDFNFDLGGIKITCYAVILAIAVAYCVFGFTKNLTLSSDKNGMILWWIAAYGAYECAVILPLSIDAAKTLPMTSFINPLGLRLQVFMILFLYWFVLPTFRSSSSAAALLSFSSLVPLAIALLDFSKGIVGYTDNGELRLLWGGVSILYAFVLITNLRLFSHRQTNYFLVAAAGIGIAIANHRSAYLVICLLAIISLLVTAKSVSRVQRFASLVMGIAAMVAILVAVPSLGHSVLSRLSTIVDTNDPNAVDRLSRWGLAWSFFLQSPINGSMLSNQYYAHQLRAEYAPHNFILELLSTEGIVGTIFYLGLIAWLLRVAYSYRSDPTMWQMFLAVTFYSCFCLFNANFLGPWNFLELALPCAMIMRRRDILCES
jgi:O-antigen ligase